MKTSTRKSADTLPQRLTNLSSGRDEMNLCEFPFATLSERSSGRNVLQFEIDDYDHELGRDVQRTLTVKGDPEFGLPTEKDEEIYLGLLKYSSDFNGFSDAEVRFSRAALFDLMNWPKSDWAYKRLAKGMHRLVGVRLSYQNLWRDNSDKQWRDQGAFGILDSFQFRDSRAANSSSFQENSSVFRWGAVLFQSFDSGYLKRIDYGLARELSPKARRLYRYLDKHFHPPHKTELTIDLARLAYQHIGVSSGIELDKVRKRHIGSAVKELIAVGYLCERNNEPFKKLRRGVWSATFQLAAKVKNPANNGGDARTRELMQSLAKRGVSTRTSLELVVGHTQEDLLQAIRALDEQLRGGREIHAVDRWIKAALKDGYRASSAVERAAKRPELRLYRRGRPVGR